MNREIKFRALDDLNKKWLLGYEYPNLGGFSMMGEVMAFGEYNRILNSFSLENWHYIKLMQYTGLKDKNGVKIYEGDIVKSSQNNSQLGEQGDIYEVIFNEKYALFCLKCVYSDNHYRINKIPLTRNNHPYFITGKRTEIIGNIYENA